MTFVAGQTLTAAQLNDLDIDSLVVDTNVLVVDKTNNRVGVGTASPSKELDVHGASNPEIRILSTDASDPALVFGDSVDGVRASIYYDTSANDLLFKGYNNNTRMTIDSSGNVGIGTASPGYKLDVEDATAAVLSLHDSGGTVGSSTNSRVIFEAGGSAAGQIGFLNTGSGIMGVQNEDGPLYLTVASNDSMLFRTNNTTRMTISNTGAVSIVGSLSKGSGSFRIPHPLPAMAETYDLVHSFVEAPQADNLYRGRVALVDGAATVDLDEAAGMTTGTFERLNRNLQCLIVNNEGWTSVRGSVAGSTLTIEAQDATCADTVDWLVIGERHDQHMYDTEWTDDDGRVIVEPLRPAQPEPDDDDDASAEDEA